MISMRAHKKEGMILAGFRKGVSIALSVLTVLVALLLAVGCVTLWAQGHGEGATGPVFTQEKVTSFLTKIAPILYAWLAVAVCGIVLRWLTPVEKEKITGVKPVKKPSPTSEKRKILWTVLFCAALLMIGAGVWNGGARDVLIKAINICMECVGLG